MSTDQTTTGTASNDAAATPANDHTANYAEHSFAVLNHTLAHSLSMAMHNAVSAQQNAQIVSNAATSATCARILAVAGGHVKKAPAKTAEVKKTAIPASGADATKRKKA